MCQWAPAADAAIGRPARSSRERPHEIDTDLLIRDDANRADRLDDLSVTRSTAHALPRSDPGQSGTRVRDLGCHVSRIGVLSTVGLVGKVISTKNV